MERVVIVFDQNVKTAPASLIRRNLGAFDPAAVRVKKEIVRRLDRSVEVRLIDWFRVRARVGFRFCRRVAALRSRARNRRGLFLCRRFPGVGGRFASRRRFLRFSLRVQRKPNCDSEQRSEKRFLHLTTVEVAVLAANWISHQERTRRSRS